MRKHRLPVTAALFAATLLSARPSRSQESAQSPHQPSYDELLRKVEQLEGRVKTLEGLDQKVKVLDRRVEIEQEEQRAKSAEAPVIRANAQGFSLSSPDNIFRYYEYLRSLFDQGASHNRDRKDESAFLSQVQIVH